MNPRLPLLLFISLAVFSCTGDSPEEKSASAAIRFATHLSTRGTVIADPAGLADKGGFKVWAYSHDAKWDTNPVKTALMDHVTVTGTTGGATVWSYENPINWPENKYVSFFAYGPTSSATLNDDQTTAQGMPVIDFTVAATPANQTDLLIASPVYDQLGPMYATGNSVGIFFNHALSRILFSGMLMNENDGRTIKVKEISLNGLYCKGTTALTNPVTWTIDNTATATYTLNISANTLNDVSLSETAQDLSTTGAMLFLMPQKLARDLGEDPVMDVTLEIDGEDLKYNSLVFSPSEWLPGKSYTYQIVVDGGDLKIIEIDSTDLTLESWASNIMVQPISLNNPSLTGLTGDEATAEITRVKTKDETRIHSALKAFALLNARDLADGIENKVKYYAIYLRNDVNHDVEINMAEYNDGFSAGEQIIFDVEKLIGSWGDDGTRYYEFKIAFDPAVWKLADSRQPPENPAFPPPDVDGISSATTSAPIEFIRHKGSIILEKLENNP